MVIAKLAGGLGNQMFQYATARRLSLTLGSELKLDLSAFRKDKKREFALGEFEIFGKSAEAGKTDREESSRETFLKKWSRLPGGREAKESISTVREKQFRFDPAILELHDNVCLEGYWQSEKYFMDVRKTIEAEFSWNYPPDQKNLETLRLIDQSESVSIHVRRGDYADDPDTRKFHGLCSESYYRTAIAWFRRRTRNPLFFIFSDDMEWARGFFHKEPGARIVHQNGNGRPHEDLRLMSRCAHQIIANSSFSWWGAWLNTKPGRQVVAPEKWFANPSVDTSDLIPATWVRL